MWWCVKLITPAEVHVYPLAEEQEHILERDLCNCLPETRQVHAGQMIVHKKFGETVRVRAHWVNPLRP